jgi:hypothetical protein
MIRFSTLKVRVINYLFIYYYGRLAWRKTLEAIEEALEVKEGFFHNFNI